MKKYVREFQKNNKKIVSKIVKAKIIFFVLTLFIISCSKNENNPEAVIPVSDCGPKNYGILLVNFAKLTERHAIDVTEVTNSNFLKSKVANIGVATDTIRLKPGVYNISIVTVDANEQSTANPVNFSNQQITQCGVKTINTSN